MPVPATLATLPNLLMLILKGFGDIEALCCIFAGSPKINQIKATIRDQIAPSFASFLGPSIQKNVGQD